MTTNRQRPNAELERAMLADYVARLEKQLDAAEMRASEAEAGARDAQKALTEALLDRAEDQKSAKGRDSVRSSPAQNELQSLRAELEATRQDLQRREAALADLREETARGLRHEFEQKLQAARERMAQEFERRLADARKPTTEDVNRADNCDQRIYPSYNVAEKAPALAAKSGISTRIVQDVSAPGKPWLALAMAIVAFVGGLALGWSAPSGGSDVVSVGAGQAPVAAEIVPAETASSQATEPPPPPAPPQIAAEPERPVDEKAVEPDALKTSEMPAESPSPDMARFTEEIRETRERSAALAQQVDALHARLDRANKRASAAEAALKSERQRAADRSRRDAANDRRRESQNQPDPTPLPPQPLAHDLAPDFRGPFRLFPMVE